MDTLRCLFGLETELGMGTDRAEDPLDSSPLAQSLMAALRKRVPNLPAANGQGVFTANGKFYEDTGGHLEVCTPEVQDPADVVRFTAANDALLVELLGVNGGPGGAPDAFLFKGNVSTEGGFRSSWGSHENYLVFGNAISPPEVHAHLASRILFTGAGGLDPTSPGVRFCLSPRATCIESTVSGSSTSARGMIHPKSESLGGRLHSRLHALCGDSNSSHLALQLRIGTTALVVALSKRLNASGVDIGLANPALALRSWNRDPGLQTTALLRSGGPVTALDVQKRLHAAVCRELETIGAAPAWARPLCERWGETLAALRAGGQAAVQCQLDWAILKSLFDAHLQARGFGEAPKLMSLTESAERTLEPPAADDDEGEMAAMTWIRQIRSAVNLSQHQRRAGEWDGASSGSTALRDLIQLRAELGEIYIRYSRLGPGGLFNTLDAAGLLKHRIPEVTDADIASARGEPPAAGRAHLRGKLIQRLAGLGDACADWTLVSSGNRRVDLPDPFASTEPPWIKFPDTRDAGRRIDRILGLLPAMEQAYDSGNYERCAGIHASFITPDTATRPEMLRLGELAAWSHVRRGHFERAHALLQTLREPLGEGGTLRWAANLAALFRFQGLVPENSAIHRIIEAGDAVLGGGLLDSPTDRFAFLEHKAVLLGRTGRVREAADLLEPLCAAHLRDHGPGRMLARGMSVLADFNRILADRPRAGRWLDEATEIQTSFGYVGDLAEFSLTLRAKLASTPAAGMALLGEACEIQHRNSHPMGLARTLLLQARLAPDSDTGVLEKLRAIERDTPGLQQCPLFRKLTAHFADWRAGRMPPGEDEVFCRL